MWQDPIVEEVHAVRDGLLARFDGDLRQYVEFALALSAADVRAMTPNIQRPALDASSDAEATRR